MPHCRPCIFQDAAGACTFRSVRVSYEHDDRVQALGNRLRPPEFPNERMGDLAEGDSKGVYAALASLSGEAGGAARRVSAFQVRAQILLDRLIRKRVEQVRPSDCAGTREQPRRGIDTAALRATKTIHASALMQSPTGSPAFTPMGISRRVKGKERPLTRKIFVRRWVEPYSRCMRASTGKCHPAHVPGAHPFGSPKQTA
jgi:hypothetical protein